MYTSNDHSTININTNISRRLIMSNRSEYTMINTNPNKEVTMTINNHNKRYQTMDIRIQELIHSRWEQEQSWSQGYCSACDAGIHTQGALWCTGVTTTRDLVHNIAKALDKEKAMTYLEEVQDMVEYEIKRLKKGGD